MYNILRSTGIYDKFSDKKKADPLISMKKTASIFFFLQYVFSYICFYIQLCPFLKKQFVMTLVCLTILVLDNK